MAKTPLFQNWSWKRTLPEPFDKEDAVSTASYSKYCIGSTKKATLHSAALSAILAYMDMDTAVTPGSTSECAYGTQGEKLVAEYQSRTGEIHAVIFNKTNRKFVAGRFDIADPSANTKVYSIKDSGNTGTALFFALLPLALKDLEFKEQYDKLASCKQAGYPDMETADEAAYILCDNLYRRIENADNLGNDGIKIVVPPTGNIQQITPLNLTKGTYSPTSVLFGTFRIFKPGSSVAASIHIDKDHFSGKYSFSSRTFSPKEQMQIPKLEDWYIIPPEVDSICKHIQLTTAGTQPMRNFLLRGPAGTGKTEAAKAIAAGLGLPYLFYTCSANTEIFDLLGQMLPDTNSSACSLPEEYPSLMDIQMDPPSAFYKLTGQYQEGITDGEVYDKLVETITLRAKQKETDSNQNGQHFRYVETPLIEAIRKGYVIEIQEPTVIANPGVLVGLNGLLDRCASVVLPTGEVVRRHPDTVVIVTTNINYAGCRDLNQSIISRMNLVIDLDEPDMDTLVNRVTKITGCTDTSVVAEMAKAVTEISEHCRETMISDGSCGVRELISWVQSYMVCGDIREAAHYTILPSATADAISRAEVEESCLDTVLPS